MEAKIRHSGYTIPKSLLWKQSYKRNMKPLVTDQQVLTWLCVLPVKETTSEWRNWSRIAFVVTFIVITLLHLSSSVTFILKFISIDFQRTSIALFTLCGAVSTINSIIVVFIMRHKIPPVYKNLSSIYEKCMSQRSLMISLIY